ncbi:MAG: PAS domain S-box protein [Ignavibacteriae bacterium]|nr:PAS domain S-box protein [Ignavibacteriota bacterium]
MPETATSSSSIDLLWTIIIGTGALVALVTAFIASLYVSQRRYLAAQREKMRALSESESRFRNLVENIKDIYYVTDARGKLTYASPNLFHASGYSERELLGQLYIRLIAREDRRRVVIHFLNCVTNGILDTSCEFRARHKDGTSIWVEQVTRILRDDTGAPTGFRNVVRDITERKQAERMLAEREQFLRTIIDVTPECVMVLNTDGNLVSLNPAGLSVVEADSVEDLRGQPINKFVELAHRREFNALLRDVLDGKKGKLEFRITGKRGTSRWLEIHAVPLQGGDRVTAILGIARDTTERKHAEETREYLTKRIIDAQESERKRISRELHDSVGQLLSAVKFRLHNVLMKAAPVSNRRSMSEIDSHLEMTIQEIRRISQNLRPSALDDLGLLSAVRALCDEFTLRTGVPIDLQLPSIPHRFSSDIELAVFRIIQETLHNAEKHSGASALFVGLQRHNSSLKVSVRDNGRGFDLERLRTRAYSARGIGLESIRERAASIGATVQISSTPGNGSEILLQIPHAPTRAETNPLTQHHIRGIAS